MNRRSVDIECHRCVGMQQRCMVRSAQRCGCCFRMYGQGSTAVWLVFRVGGMKGLVRLIEALVSHAGSTMYIGECIERWAGGVVETLVTFPSSGEV